MEYLYTDIYKKLEEKIKGMEVGEKLPSERLMVQEYGVSRNVLREALVLLSDRGMIEIRPGKGSYVANKQSARLANHFESVITDEMANQIKALEVREILEQAIFEKAALNADEKDIEEMEAIFAEMEKATLNGPTYSALDLKLHMKIAESTHNMIFSVLVRTLYKATGQRILMIEELFPDAMKSVHRDHQALIDAIKRRDVKTARKVGKRHFDFDRYVLLSNEKEG